MTAGIIQKASIMGMSHFHDFYFLQAMEAAVKMELSSRPELEFQKPVEKFLDDLDTAVDKIVPNMALRTMLYLWAASFGEARHAKDSVARDCYISAKIKAARGEWFGNAVNYPPTKANIKALKQVFEQDWRSGYGGEAWANIVQAIAEYETTPPAAWIDHVVDLEHNNGTAFSKPEGEETLYFSVHYPHRFSSFLDYKFHKDILVKPPSYTTSALEVTPKVYSLLSRFSNLFNRPEVKHVIPGLETLSPYEVEWGDGEIVLEDKWSNWATVSENNKPNVMSLLNDAGLYEFYAGYFTKDKYLRKIKHVERRAIGKVHPKFATASFKTKIKKELAKFAKRNISKCKIDKAKTTYTLLPCKLIAQEYGKIKLCFELPYQDGYGEPTDNGFAVWVDVYAPEIEQAELYIARQYGDTVLWAKNQYHYVNSPILEALID